MMQLTQRTATLTLLVIESLAACLGLIALSALGSDPTSQRALVLAIPLVIGLTIAYWRGWDAARYVNLALATFLVCGPFIDPQVDRSFSPALFIPSALALVAAAPWWVGGSGALIVLVLNLRGGGVYARPDILVILVLIFSSMVVGRLIADQARAAAEQTAREVAHERGRFAAEASQRLAQAEELAQQNAEQRRLLDLVATLEAPAVLIASDVLLAPLIGSFDGPRLRALGNRLLAQVAARRIRLVVVDVAGVALVTPDLAVGVAGIARAIQLLGCRVAISGISPQIALSMAQQDLGFPDVITSASPYEALATAGILQAQPAA
jgi:anti-anti-sigma regulatory factor